MSLPSVTSAPPPPYPVDRPAFAPGDAVAVRRAAGPGHMRTPGYLRGKRGRVERVCGGFENPEALAYNREAETRPLYRVRFTMAELWGARAERPDDTTDVEIYEHWLEADDAA